MMVFDEDWYNSEQRFGFLTIMIFDTDSIDYTETSTEVCTTCKNSLPLFPVWDFWFD